MEFSALEIASILEGKVRGNQDIKVSSVSKIEEGKAGSISFLSNLKYEPYLYNTKASIVIVSKDFEPSKDVSSTLIFVEDAYKAFAKLLTYAGQFRNQKIGIEKNVQVHETAKLGKNIYIGSFVFIDENTEIGDNVKVYSNVHIGENVSVGEGSVIHSGARLYADTKIGKNCIIHSNTVIGADGFGFTPKADGTLEKVPQIGNVIIEDYVEIGAGCTIDRATLGSTIIHSGVKLDNQIQIAHNVEINSNTVIASQTGIAGSTKIGKNCMIGGQVGIIGHLKIGDFVQIQAQSGVNNNIPTYGKVYGSPAMDASDFRKSYVYFRNFPSIIKRLEELEKEIKQQTIKD
ncbi:MAG: UDP-3-O-(3-hydroxymyristoyl)glucosamine N-acyltransferase [Weeksellaceae bacterium]|jgi:UDP-3-O-[3-hydroxymyristoyl] glucosamine N-acyltransferase|nr:UDP-3-O-(3-hydroxymyristoyl)glucosamine N-acyltransferase [Weeksellaceae bacterium]MDX9704718.1 UDP-3-O-(3-hydroxymyristoyl)glucosamine N-acyltransferase [Weeksellaceae bacterium]